MVKSWKLDVKKKLTLGRGPTNTIVLYDPKVHICQASIEFLGNGFYICQEVERGGSSVYVNGKSILHMVLVSAGDKIQIGYSTFFIVDDEQEEQQTSKTHPTR